MARRSTVLAAGAVVWKRQDGHTWLLLIHRPKYDDWTFPKGKVDRGESLPATATREVMEETGVRARLGVPMLEQTYHPRNGSDTTKHVRYWVGRPDGAHDISTYLPNHEVDRVRWVRLRDVPDLLTYDRDRTLVERLRELKRRDGHSVRTLLIVRHAHARSRSRWPGPDEDRTLTRAGERQLPRLTTTIAAYGVRRVFSSDTARCIATVLPYADRIDADVVLEPRLHEEDPDPSRVRRAVYDLLDHRRPVVAVTHRPVLPYVTDALGIEPEPLEPAEMLVVHHRDGDVLATERYPH